jgi:hypothetical protein
MPAIARRTGSIVGACLGIATAFLLIVAVFALAPHSSPAPLWVANQSLEHDWNWSSGDPSDSGPGAANFFQVIAVSHFAVLGSSENSTLVLNVSGYSDDGPNGEVVTMFVILSGAMEPRIQPSSVTMVAISTNASSDTPPGQWLPDWPENNTTGNGWYNADFSHVGWYGANGSGWFQVGLTNQDQPWHGGAPTQYEFELTCEFQIQSIELPADTWLNTTSVLTLAATLGGLSEPVTSTVVIDIDHGYNPALTPPQIEPVKLSGAARS